MAFLYTCSNEAACLGPSRLDGSCCVDYDGLSSRRSPAMQTSENYLCMLDRSSIVGSTKYSVLYVARNELQNSFIECAAVGAPMPQ